MTDILCGNLQQVSSKVCDMAMHSEYYFISKYLLQDMGPQLMTFNQHSPQSPFQQNLQLLFLKSMFLLHQLSWMLTTSLLSRDTFVTLAVMS